MVHCRRLIVVLLIASILQIFTVQAIGEGNEENGTDAERSGFNLNDIEISINGLPIEDVIGTASGMFTDAIKENMGEAINGLNDIFGEFAESFSADLGELGTMVDSLIEETWVLKMPAVSFDTTIKRSVYDNALDLYKAQANEETGTGGRIALDAVEGCGNNLIYIYDETELITAILESVEAGTFSESEITFGLEGYYGTYAVSAVLFLSPSDEPSAMCNMTDLSDEQQFNAFRNYIDEHAAKNYDEPFEYGDQLLTIVFWNQDAGADWLTVVAKEIPTMLETIEIN